MRRISESNMARKNTNEYHDISSCFEQLPFHVISSIHCFISFSFLQCDFSKTHRRVGLVNSFHPTLRPRALVSLNKRTRRQQERHLRMQLSVSRFVFIPRLFQVVWLAKCFLTILELYWWSGLEMEIRTKNMSRASSKQLQNRSFHVVERIRTAAKCTNMKNARAKRAKLLFFIVQYANL